MSVIISAKNISKQYYLRHDYSGKYKTLRESITLSSIRNAGRIKSNHELFSALDDVSFEINKGDRVGIIGRNGAGKSTLLKILSRITEPTTGKIFLKGRVASLLEVGTGFHPELTGRENIFLNGSILGMAHSEIKTKFDEIVAFAEIERFLDTPVKRYSSGMYVRLAFAVAAHLEPEILIVDEVLAVGDAQFQKKCLGKMQDVAHGGRTILFVSHNMAAVQNLCTSIMWLDKGKLVAHGKTPDTISAYMQSSPGTELIYIGERKDRSGNGDIRFLSAELKSKDGQLISAMQCGSADRLSLRIEVNKENLSNLQIAAGIDDEYGQRIAHLSNDVTGELLSASGKGEFTVDIMINKVPFRSGRYSFTLFASTNAGIADWVQQAGSFFVEDGDYFNTGKLPPAGQGAFFIDHTFSIRKT